MANLDGTSSVGCRAAARRCPLTDLGRQQAQLAADRLQASAATGIWSSDQLRAMDTAAIIAARLGLPVTLTPDLREQHLGELEGRSYDELRPEPVPEGRHISEVRWGGGESVADVHARVRGFLPTLTGHDEGDRPHGDTLRILRAVLGHRSHRAVEWVEFGNGEVQTVSWQPTPP